MAKADVDAQGDAIYYAAQAQTVSDGDWFPTPPPPPARRRPGGQPTTRRSLAGAGPRVARLHTLLAQRLAMGVLGAGVVVPSLLARRIAGDTPGLIAAGLAAVYSNLWLNDALTMSETLTAAGVAAIFLAVYALWDRPSVRGQPSWGHSWA